MSIDPPLAILRRVCPATGVEVKGDRQCRVSLKHRMLPEQHCLGWRMGLAEISGVRRVGHEALEQREGIKRLGAVVFYSLHLSLLPL